MYDYQNLVKLKREFCVFLFATLGSGVYLCGIENQEDKVETQRIWVQ